MVSDDTITRLILGTGWKPGDRVDDDAVRLWMGAIAAECVKAIEAVRDRMEHKPSAFIGDEAARASRVTAENCIRAIQAALGQ